MCCKTICTILHQKVQNKFMYLILLSLNYNTTHLFQLSFSDWSDDIAAFHELLTVWHCSVQHVLYKFCKVPLQRSWCDSVTLVFAFLIIIIISCGARHNKPRPLLPPSEWYWLVNGLIFEIPFLGYFGAWGYFWAILLLPMQNLTSGSCSATPFPIMATKFRAYLA